MESMNIKSRSEVGGGVGNGRQRMAGEMTREESQAEGGVRSHTQVWHRQPMLRIRAHSL